MATERSAIEGLSPRERECLALAGRHLSSKEIARRLGLSPGTVDAHLVNAMRKLGVASRREAIRLMEMSEPNGNLSGPREDPHSQSSGGGKRVEASHDPRRYKGSGEEPRWLRPTGMFAVLLRSLLDAFYVTVFFALISICAYLAHQIVSQCEAAHVDPVVIWMLKALHYTLLAIDGVGVVCATVFLTWRFVRAIKDADD